MTNTTIQQPSILLPLLLLLLWRCCVVAAICCIGIPEGHRPTSADFKSLISVPGSAVCSTITPSWLAKMNLSFNGPVPAPPAAAAAVDAIINKGP